MGNDLVDSADRSAFDSGADLIAYTCNDTWTDVTIVYFKIVENNILSDNGGN